MSDGQRFSNPGNGNDDVYRWSGDGRNNSQNSNGDNYIYDGSRRNQQSNRGGDDCYDAFQRDRMPGRVREGDYPQTFVQRETRSDGTQIINVIHCKNAYFNQSEGNGADYRRDPRQDFRNYDDDCNRLQRRNQTNYYDNNENCDPRSRYNNSYRQIEPRYDDFRQRDYDRHQQDSAYRLREQQDMYERQQEMRQRQLIEAQRQRDCERQYEREQQIANMRQYQRDCDQSVRIQMYNENCRNSNGRYPYQQMPYYVNDGCFGNGRNGGYYPDRYDSGYGGPSFGYGNRNQIAIRIPLGHHSGAGIRIGF